MTELDQLLMRIRDGDTTPATLARARALLAEDVRLPADLREIGLEDDDPAIAAAALLGVLGLDEGLFGGLIGEALQFEAGARPTPIPPVVEAPITAADLAAQEAAGLPPVAEAVAALAGDIDIDIAVLVALGVQVVDVGPAVRGHAGETAVSGAVAARLGSVPTQVAAAVRSEAGDVDVSVDVVSPLGDPLWPIAAAVRSVAGVVELAPAVLEALGEVSVPIAAAVADAAGELDVAPAVLHNLGVQALPVADAVAAEAGTIDVLATLGPAFAEGWVAGLLDRELPAAAHRLAAARVLRHPEVAAELTAFAEVGRHVRTAITESCGATPYLWEHVAAELGLADPEQVAGYEEGVVAQAVRESAGSIQVAPAVMAQLRPVAVAPEADPVPEAANTAPWRWAGVALAAAALIVVIVGRVAPLDAMLGDGEPSSVMWTPDFASADEVQVEELDYDEGVNVTVQLPDEEGDRPLIIWVNEEA
jgi:hypothetical protein